jgi:hypothetical protein
LAVLYYFGFRSVNSESQQRADRCDDNSDRHGVPVMTDPEAWWRGGSLRPQMNFDRFIAAAGA